MDHGSRYRYRCRPLPALYWAEIRWAKAEACDTFDLGGSIRSLPPNPKDPDYGVYTFKTRLGASLRYSIVYHDLILRTCLYRFFRMAERVWRLWWQLQERLTTTLSSYADGNICRPEERGLQRERAGLREEARPFFFAQSGSARP